MINIILAQSLLFMRVSGANYMHRLKQTQVNEEGVMIPSNGCVFVVLLYILGFW
jgi:hypothetical protein